MVDASEQDVLDRLRELQEKVYPGSIDPPKKFTIGKDDFSLGAISPDAIATDQIRIGDTLYKEEDGNSPVDTTPSFPYTYTLANEYDEVAVILDISNASSGAGRLDARVNGDSGTNYDLVDRSGTKTTGASEGQLLSYLSGGMTRRVVFEIDGRWTDRCQLDVVKQGAVGSSGLDEVENAAVTSPLTEFTLLSSFGTANNLTMRVYGRGV